MTDEKVIPLDEEKSIIVHNDKGVLRIKHDGVAIQRIVEVLIEFCERDKPIKIIIEDISEG